MMGNFSSVHLPLAWVTSGKLQNQQRIIIIHFSWVFFLLLFLSLSSDWLEMLKIPWNFFTSTRVLMREVKLDTWNLNLNCRSENSDLEVPEIIDFILSSKNFEMLYDGLVSSFRLGCFHNIIQNSYINSIIRRNRAG